MEPRRDDRHRVPPLRATSVARPERRRYRRYLLDLDPDLVGDLDVRMRLVARPAATAVTFELDPGHLDLAGWLGAASTGPGLLVLGGALVGYTRVCDRVSAELLGRGDVIQPGHDDVDELVCGETVWRALEPVQFAILDGSFAERVRPWPSIGCTLLRRCERRARDLAVTRAIAAQPRLDLRLVLLLWHLAARWGRVEPGGVRLSLPLTHELLGRLAGAERPSVTHALKRLGEAGLMSGDDRGRHLHGTLAEHLIAIAGRGGHPAGELLSSSTRLR